MTTTNFPNGISCADGGDVLGTFPLTVPLNYSIQSDDFYQLETTDNWTLTQTNGTAAIGGATGVVTLALAGADNDKALLASKVIPVALQAGKKFAFTTRFKVTGEATHVIGKEGLVIGLASIATGTNFISADGTTMAFDNGIGFYSSPASNLPSIFSRSGDTESRTSLASLGVTYGDNVWQVFHVTYDGAVLTYYFGTDDAMRKVGSITTNIPTASLAPTFYIEAGEAKTKTLAVDYFQVIAER
jgi:hypothetical protein